MLSPLKLFVMTTGGVVVLAVAPYGISHFASSKSEPESNRLTVAEQAQKPQNAAAMQELPAPRVENKLDVLSAKRTTPPPRAIKAEEERKSIASVAPAAGESIPQAAVSVPQAAVKEVAELPKPAVPTKNDSAPGAAAVSPSPAPAPTPTPKPEIPYRAEVEKAQQFLAKLGYNVGKIDGKLGQKTELYLTAFQKENGLRAFGEADSKTIEALEKAVAALDKEAVAEELEETETADADEGADSDDPQVVVLRKEKKSSRNVDPGPVPTLKSVADVKRLQEKLVEAKLYAEEPDGKWGEKTIQAMKDFQEKNGLKVTGKPNTDTWKKMHEVSPEEWTVVKKSEKRNRTNKEVADSGKSGGKKKASTEKTLKGDNTKTRSALEDETKKSLTISVVELAAKADAQPQAGSDSEKDKPSAREASTKAKIAKGEPKGERLEVSKPISASSNKELAASPEGAAAQEEPSPTIAAKAESPQDVPSLSGASVEKSDKVAAAVASEQSEEVVVKVNPDAGDNAVVALSTPAAVTAGPLVNPLAPVVENKALSSGGSSGTAAPDGEIAAVDARPVLVKVHAPKRDDASGKEVALAENPELEKNEGDLPSAVSRQASRKLKSDLEEATARIAMVSNDPHYEVEKYAPKMLESVNGLVEKLKANSGTDDPETSRKNLAMIEKELEQAKQESLRRKAERKVSDVESIYKNVKDRYAEQIKKAPLADLMGKIDNGYTAMQADFKKGNYDPIVERCDGFKLQIEILANEAAKAYLESELEDRKVTAKLNKSTLSEIQDLRKRNKYMEAADLLSAALKKVKGSSTSDSSSKSRSKSSKSSSSKKTKG